MMDWMLRSLVVLQFAGPSNSQLDMFGAMVVCGNDPRVYGQGWKSEAGVVPCVAMGYWFPSEQVQNDPSRKSGSALPENSIIDMLSVVPIWENLLGQAVWFCGKCGACDEGSRRRCLRAGMRCLLFNEQVDSSHKITMLQLTKVAVVPVMLFRREAVLLVDVRMLLEVAEELGSGGNDISVFVDARLLRLPSPAAIVVVLAVAEIGVFEDEKETLEEFRLITYGVCELETGAYECSVRHTCHTRRGQLTVFVLLPRI